MKTFIALLVLVLPITTIASTLGVITTPLTVGLNSPTAIVNAGDNSDRLFIVEQGGQVRVIRDEVLQPSPLLTIDAATQCASIEGGVLQNIGFSDDSERGLLGLAFHPDYATNGQLFLSYTDGNSDSIITRITMTSPQADMASVADLNTCLVILRVDQDFGNNKGGHIAFGPDGYLYFGLGDGGSSHDPCGRAQTLNPANLMGSSMGGLGFDCPADNAFLANGGNSDSRALLGKMMRLNIDSTTPAGANQLCAANGDGSANYAIPASNPFAGADAQSACDEVWLYGLHNPRKWSFDRLTGDMFIGDIGENAWEEVSLIQPVMGGSNLGWDVCEGVHFTSQCNAICGVAGSILPVIEYKNSFSACFSNPEPGYSVIGGYRYRGPDTALQGVYFYGDLYAPGLRISQENPDNSWQQPTASTILFTSSIRTFGEGEDGSLYFLSVIAGDNYQLFSITNNNLFSDGFE